MSHPLLDDALETKAAYRESRIKTYGFQRVAGLSLLRMTVHSEDYGVLGGGLLPFGEAGADFPPGFLTASRSSFGGLARCDGTVGQNYRRTVWREFLAGTDKAVRPGVPAEMVFFQGPHFGDRYGILEAAVRGLAAKRVKMTAAACSGSCIYIVLPRGNQRKRCCSFRGV